MSDFYRNDPYENDPFDGEGQSQGGPNRWQQPDPFAADSAAQPQEEFSAWRRPEQARTPSFLMDEPTPYGAEMQQGGVPLFGAEGLFPQDEGDAPTRIGMPAITPQMVNRRKTVDRGEQLGFAPPPFPERQGLSAPEAPSGVEESLPSTLGIPSTPPADSGRVRQRRAGRGARYQEEGGLGEPVESKAVPGLTPLPKPKAQFDPFQAGDMETEQTAESRMARRPAKPGERYTGARTAIPQSGAPIPRSQVGVLPDYGEEARNPSLERALPPREKIGEQPGMRLLEDEGSSRSSNRPPDRPPQGHQPQNRPPQNRPPQNRPPQVRSPQMRRPQDGSQGVPNRPAQARSPQDQDRAPQDRSPQARPPQDRAPQARGGVPPRQLQDRRHFDEEKARYQPSRRDEFEDSGVYSRQASVKRPTYDFEEEDDFQIRRRTGCLMPLLIVLLVVGGLLAGLCLPAWDASNTGITGALGSAKATVMNLFSLVKNAIAPEEEAITQFSVVPTEGTAPAELVFNVQTSTKVTDLRIVDQNGAVILQKTLTDKDTLGGDITKNSKGMIWVLRHTVREGYQGLYTVQSQVPDGTWNEGLALDEPVNIAAPVVAAPPIQGFSCEPTEPTVPAMVTFTVDTSTDVAEIRIVDDYGSTVVSHTFGDEETAEASAVESSDGIFWELTASVSEAYQGNYTLQYRTESELSFALSSESAYVELTDPIQEDEEDVLSEGELSEGLDDDLLAEDDGDGLLAEEEGEDVLAEGEGEAVAVASANVAEPIPTATAAPVATPLPRLSAEAEESALPSAISLKATAYNGSKTTSSYSRASSISMVDPFNYSLWPQSGVLTFRGGPFRQNAAYGTATVSQESLVQLWKEDVGSTKLSKSTVYGIAWPGQPVIVKWPTQLRDLMAILKEKQSAYALKEVIVGGQDGKIYFLDLADGQPTRDPIDMGAPSSGGASIATNIAPILGMGQSHGNLSGKQVDNGYHFYDLLTNKELILVSSRDKAANSSYTGVSGAALFDKTTGTAIFGSQNGLLYAVELGNLTESFDYEAGKLLVKSPNTQRYKTQASKQDKKNTNIDGSVAMYNNYVFYGDEAGVLQCMDVNTLQPVWAVKTGDNIDATPALDMEEGETLALYTGNTIRAQGKKGVSTIRRYNALTGEEVWSYEVPELAYTTEFKIGCVASPVVGENDISDLVIFTATNGKKGSTIIALKKSDGSEVWTTAMESEGLSSPVAVYSESGQAWIVQAESNGNVHLLDGKTGEIKHTLQLDGEIEASPAVYKNTVVIGTTGKDKGAIYGIQIQ